VWVQGLLRRARVCHLSGLSLLLLLLVQIRRLELLVLKVGAALVVELVEL